MEAEIERVVRSRDLKALGVVLRRHKRRLAEVSKNDDVLVGRLARLFLSKKGGWVSSPFALLQTGLDLGFVVARGLRVPDEESGWTAAHHAAYNGNLSELHFLLQLNPGGDLMRVRDRDGKTVLDLLAYDLDICSEKASTLIELGERRVPQVKEDFVYSWGSNVNFTLGREDGKDRIMSPSLLRMGSESEFFLNKLRVKKVETNKFHTCILTHEGQLLVCGRGQNGRLGAPDAATKLAFGSVPSLNQVKISDFAMGRDHTVVSCGDGGGVFVFGSNKHNQLGLPGTTHVEAPALIGRAIKDALCVGASDIHTVVCTATDMFVCGLNRGQMGLDDKSSKIEELTLVRCASLNTRSVVMVSTSPQLTVCLLSSGQILILRNYSHVKLNIPKSYFPRTLGVYMKEMRVACVKVQVYLGKYIFTLGENGRLAIREEETCCPIFFSTPCTLYVQDFVVCGADVAHCHLFVVSRDGQLFESSFDLQLAFEGSHLPLQRVPGLHQVVKVAADPLGEHFFAVRRPHREAVLSSEAIRAPLGHAPIHLPLPQSSDNRILQDLIALFETQEGCDLNLIPADGSSPISVHAYILAWKSVPFRELIAQGREEGLGELYIPRLTGTELEAVISYIYTGVWNMTALSALASRPSELDAVLFEVLNAEYPVIKAPTKKKPKVKASTMAVSSSSRPRANPSQPPHLSEFSEMCDVLLECGEEAVPCHKAMLVARSEFFRIRFGSRWMDQSQGKHGLIRVSLPLDRLRYPEYVVSGFLHFVYGDCLPQSEAYPLNALFELLSLGTALMIPSLTHLCEIAITKLLSLTSLASIVNFGLKFDSIYILEAAVGFVLLNLEMVFEGKTFDHLPLEFLTRATSVYEQMLPMSRTGYMNLEMYTKSPLISRNLLSPVPSRRTLSESSLSTNDASVSTPPEKLSANTNLSLDVGESNILSTSLEEDGEPYSISTKSDLETCNSLNSKKKKQKFKRLDSYLADQAKKESKSTSVEPDNLIKTSPMAIVTPPRSNPWAIAQPKHGSVESPLSSSSEKSSLSFLDVVNEQRKERGKASRGVPLSPGSCLPTPPKSIPIAKKSSPLQPWGSLPSPSTFPSPKIAFLDLLDEAESEEKQKRAHEAALKQKQDAEKKKMEVLAADRAKAPWAELKAQKPAQTPTQKPPSSPQKVSFSSIMNSQVREKEIDFRERHRPLRSVQTEEKAIEDLLAHYQLWESSADEIILVTRKKLSTAPQ